VLRRAVAASATDTVLVEGSRPVLEATLADLGYRVVTETWLRETSAHPLSVVEAVEARLNDVANGLRFGETVPPADGETPATTFVVADLPADLVDAASGIDPEAARAAVAGAAVAFETTENGAKPRGRVALPSTDPTAAAAAVTGGLADVLRRSYDDVRRTNGEIVARTAAFDPVAARRLGVPEGPAFGRLADGESVEIDGERIDPDVVRTERVERFRAVSASET
jgi:D-aminoacyl-tRNA deacylase